VYEILHEISGQYYTARFMNSFIVKKLSRDVAIEKQ